MSSQGISEHLKAALPHGLVHRISEWRRGRIDRKIGQSPFYVTYSSALPYRAINTRALVSDRYRYVYFRVPKAANSSVVATLMHMEGAASTLSSKEVEAFKTSGRRLSTLGLEEVDKVRNHYFKFAIVRNPYTRVISAYRDKIEKVTAFRPRVSRFLGKGPDEPVGFEEFLDYLEFGGGLRDDAHWALQSELILLPVERLDAIGKVETLDCDLPGILQSIYGTRGGPVRFSPHATNAGSAAVQLGSRTVDRIYRLYQKDFESFSYPRSLT